MRSDKFNVSYRLPAWRIYWRDNTNFTGHPNVLPESIDEFVESVDDVLRFWPPLRDSTSRRYCGLSLLAELGDTFLP